MGRVRAADLHSRTEGADRTRNPGPPTARFISRQGPGRRTSGAPRAHHAGQAVGGEAKHGAYGKRDPGANGFVDRVHAEPKRDSRAPERRRREGEEGQTRLEHERAGRGAEDQGGDDSAAADRDPDRVGQQHPQDTRQRGDDGLLQA